MHPHICSVWKLVILDIILDLNVLNDNDVLLFKVKCKTELAVADVHTLFTQVEV